MSFDVMNIFLNVRFAPKELVIKEQYNCKSTGHWKANSEKTQF